MENKIKKMTEEGFAPKRIASILQLSKKEINTLIINNNWSLIKDNFSEDKIDDICNLYKQGVSAKQLGIKYSIDKRRIQKWAENKNILRNRSDSHRFTKFNQNIFDIIDAPAKAYWLGFFYADAYNCDITNTFSITLKDEDNGHLIKLCNFINLPSSKVSKYISKIGDKEYPTCCVRLYSKHICEKMTDLGCPRAKSFIIKYPNWLDKKFNIDFLRGMFDGDGSLAHRTNNEWKWSLATTKECGEVIQRIILNELDMIVNLSCISKTGHNTYELESNGNEKVLKLSKWLYDNSDKSIRLDRKYSKMLELSDQQNNRHFSRATYKVSEEQKNQILFDKNNTSKSDIELSKENKLHISTIKKILINDKFLFDKIVCINNQQITAKYVKTLDLEGRKALIEPLFHIFRDQGWLYPDNTTKLKNSYQKLCKWNPNLNSDELINNNSLATDICKFFCHKFYDATEHGQSTMQEVFNDDIKLKKLIWNRLGLDWWEVESNDETFNISFKMLIQGMRSSRLVPSISMFKPNISKYLCIKYSQENDTVYDYSVGWGGRMLGAASCNRKYIGVDPWTTDEVQKMAEYFDLKNITLINDISENIRLNENSIDLSFSSPPYFDQEVYSLDKSQSYNNGTDYFYNIYWKNTLENIKYMLKPGKWFGLNITNNHIKMLNMAQEIFGEYKEIIKLKTIRNHLTKSAGIVKYEPIYMFQNIK